jgi:hypothetical protein
MGKSRLRQRLTDAHWRLSCAPAISNGTSTSPRGHAPISRNLAHLLCREKTLKGWYIHKHSSRHHPPSTAYWCWESSRATQPPPAKKLDQRNGPVKLKASSTLELMRAAYTVAAGTTGPPCVLSCAVPAPPAGPATALPFITNVTVAAVRSTPIPTCRGARW